VGALSPDEAEEASAKLSSGVRIVSRPPTKLAIILAMETLPLADVKNRLSEVVDRVASQNDRVTITRNGRPAAVLMSPDDLESLEETLSVLSNPKELASLRRGLADLDAGRAVSLATLRADLGLDE
jgi:antitoxin YefM